MTSISNIPDFEERNKVEAITFGRWLNCVFWAVLITSLALTHVYFKFTASDYSRSAGRIQKRREALENIVNEKRIKLAELESGRHAQAWAKELGMTVADRNQMETLNDKSRRQLEELTALYQSTQTVGEDSRLQNSFKDNSGDRLKANMFDRVVAGITQQVGEKMVRLKDMNLQK
ncbi:MAG: hypothetical protein NTX50_21870 [Candidatus Sumerlaeota bacterium]|nr:hypothetical protein [Candidatus Sumerlaeota bacterium]